MLRERGGRVYTRNCSALFVPPESERKGFPKGDELGATKGEERELIK